MEAPSTPTISQRSSMIFRLIIELKGDPMSFYPILFLVGILILALFGPSIAPHGPQEIQYGADGQLLRAVGPSLEHPLGTTAAGYDVLSRLIYGAQPAAITGFVGGGLIILFGGSIGITAGYMGGRIDSALMRITDIVYSLPLIPFAIVIVAFFGTGFYVSIIVIGLILWRGSARMLRSQVLQIKEREYIRAVEAMGASPFRVIYRHILPNIGAMVALFFAFGVGTAILVQAGLAFIGITSPFVPSWGIMLRNAFQAGYTARQLGWSLPPGFMISFTVLSTFLIGRRIESRHKEIGAIAEQ